MASKAGAEKALRATWKRSPATLRLMRLSVRVGKGIFDNKPSHKEAAEYELLLARVAALKVAFPKLWRRVIIENPEPNFWGAGIGWQPLLSELKGSRNRSLIFMDALQSLAISELQKRTAAQLITVVVMCALRTARKPAPSGTELALLAIVTGFEEPTSVAHSQRQRPDTWNNCIETCGPWVDWLMDPTPVKIRVFPDDFPEHQLGSAALSSPTK